MSPEQLQGSYQATATDVYGLGTLLFEMLYGHPPFDGGSASEVFLGILKQVPVFPETPIVPGPVRDFIQRCLAKSPTDRPSDGRAARDELHQLLATTVALPMVAGMAPAPIAGPPAQAALATTRSTIVTFALPASRWPWVVAGVGSVVTVGAWLLAFRNSRTILPIVLLILAAFAGTLASMGIAWIVHRWIEKRRPPLGDTVATLLGRAQSTLDLTKSLAIDIGRLVEACRQLDQQILAKTLALMVGEYDKANASTDRQAALMRAVELMEKLRIRLAPWYVRHQALLSWGIGIAGTTLSVVKTAHELWRIAKH
jgi:hypothetical protein